MRRPVQLILHILIAYGFARSQWLWLPGQGLTMGRGSSGTNLPGPLGPMVAAFTVTTLTEGRAGLVDLLQRMGRLPKRPGAFLAGLAMPVVLATGALGWQVLHGHPLPPFAAFTAFPGLAAGTGLAGVLVVLGLNGFGEETGWRGWLFDTLCAKHGPFLSAVIVALVWMLRHLPLFWLNPTLHALIGPLLLGWAAGLVLGSFVLAHICQFTERSTLAAAVWHVPYNYYVATEATSGIVAAVVSSAVMAWGAGVALVWGRHWWRNRATLAEGPQKDGGRAAATGLSSTASAAIALCSVFRTMLRRLAGTVESRAPGRVLPFCHH